MSTKKKFTPEEIRHLRANPYTLKVSEETISYTLAFKEAFWALSLQGYTGMAAFRKLGYNTQVLGFERIHNTTKRIRKEGRSLKGLHETARGGVRLSGREDARQELRLPHQTRLPGGDRMSSAADGVFKKVMRLHDKPGK